MDASSTNDKGGCIHILSFTITPKNLTLTDAINSVLDHGTIELLTDVTLSEKLVVEGSVSLFLRGHTLTLADVPDDYGVVVKEYLSFNKSGTVVVPGTYGIGVAEGAKLMVEESHMIAGEKNAYIISNFGQTDIFGGIFEGTYCCVNNIQGYTYIGGGIFSTAATDWTGEYEASDVLNGGDMGIYSGTFSKPIDPALCGEGKCVKPNEDGTYSVVRKANIIQNPYYSYKTHGEQAQFTVYVEGEGITYRWEYSRNGTAWYDTKLEGYDTDTLTVPVLVSRDGYKYRCIVTDAYGNETVSAEAILIVE